MTLLQPLLHDLTCTYAAPIQVWSEQSGLIIDSGINGIYLADTRLIREVSLNISADDVHHLSGEILSHRHTRTTWVLRNADMATDPEVTLTIDRTVAIPPADPAPSPRHTRSPTPPRSPSPPASW
ncbi:glycogen debranching N-terminal domain-containing protein [Trueperella sp.]|uniref:glycogen debranching N-terminal domain-containing protein n=1 Tax=Trueperella sp. TaxID=2699835 RepID=UPI00263752E9|nr:glycogen debranching N-terminal domain-containing protein [Trueperella sp.]